MNSLPWDSPKHLVTFTLKSENPGKKIQAGKCALMQ